jgi:hypothetical protein
MRGRLIGNESPVLAGVSGQNRLGSLANAGLCFFKSAYLPRVRRALQAMNCGAIALLFGPSSEVTASDNAHGVTQSNRDRSIGA